RRAIERRETMYQWLVAFVNSLKTAARAVRERLSDWPRWINPLTPRGSLIVIAVIGVSTGLIFGFFPELDLQITAYFYDPVQRTWPTDRSVLLGALRNLNAYVAIIFVVIAIGVRVFKAIFSGGQPYVSLRRAIFLVGSFVLGPGLIVNVLLKPEWGR